MKTDKSRIANAHETALADARLEIEINAILSTMSEENREQLKRWLQNEIKKARGSGAKLVRDILHKIFEDYEQRFMDLSTMIVLLDMRLEKLKAESGVEKK